MTRRTAILASVGLLFALPIRQGASHTLGVVRIHVTESGRNRYLLTAQLPPNSQVPSAPPVFPPKCRQDQAAVIERGQTITKIQIPFTCEAAPGTGDTLRLPWPFQGAFVAREQRDELASGRFFEAVPDGIVIPLNIQEHSLNSQGGWNVAQRYLALGVEHILTGWDHLSFVLTLCLIASGLKLLKLVSAFTLGHSMTLALASLGVVHVPIPPTEACIALSITFMARAVIHRDSVPHGAGLVFSFGLLHGLGFATALAESGIDRSEFFIGLVTFNLGVETGQLLFVAAVFTVALVGRKWCSEQRRQLATATAYVLGTISTFWTLQRIIS